MSICRANWPDSVCRKPSPCDCRISSTARTTASPDAAGTRGGGRSGGSCRVLHASAASGGEGNAMTAPRKGSRRIVVDGETYLWRVPRRPSSGAWDGNCGYTITVQRADRRGSVLAVSVPRKHPAIARLWGEKIDSVFPSHIAAAIAQALHAGWNPRDHQPNFGVTLDFSASEPV